MRRGSARLHRGFGFEAFVVASHGDHAVMSSADFPYENLLVGLHGSVTADEMEIPILVC